MELDEEKLKKLCEPPSSLQLKNTLTDTLCKMGDTDSLLKIFNTGDPNFQVKVFPKLPAVTEFHLEVVGKVMNSKSWRQKLTILQNIDSRTEKGENTYTLVPKLFEFLGDKIACVRVALGETISKIVAKKRTTVS